MHPINISRTTVQHMYNWKGIQILTIRLISKGLRFLIHPVYPIEHTWPCSNSLREWLHPRRNLRHAIKVRIMVDGRVHFNYLCIHAYNCVQIDCARVVSFISKQFWRERDTEVRQYKVINGQAMNCYKK
jgi:hypothetical protein